ncbi:BnaC02g24400D [Brassica napus]|uniref:BnaC02g24400D protein n=1 Tax=Brassica napus TaxID=3708 RepID=A0A078G4M1_BRANA|nr:BnaC02g24400D [Brassica napus]
MRRCLYFSPLVSPTTMNSISSFPKNLMKTLKRTFYETRQTRDVNETRDLNKGGELIEVDMLLDEKSSLIKISVSVHRLNTFRELLKEGALYELSGFDVTRSNNHFKLCNSNVAIRLNQSTKMVEVPAVANPR